LTLIEPSPPPTPSALAPEEDVSYNNGMTRNRIPSRPKTLKASTLALSAVFALSAAPVSIAGDAPCPQPSSANPDPISSDVKKVIQNMRLADQGQAKAHMIDAEFNFKVVNEGKYLRAESAVPNLPWESYSKAYDLMRVTSGTFSAFNNYGPPATSFDQAMGILKQQSKTLTTNEKLLYLSMLGSRLSSGYEASGKTSRSLEDTFQNMVNSGKEGGICGSIHEYLSRAATALGFESSGLGSSNWQKVGASKKDDGNHYIAYFKDPATGRYYSQNYSRIIDTGQKTIQGAVDVATQVLAPLTGVSSVESKPGTFHMYVPSTARWVEQQLSHGTNFNPGDATLSLQVGNVDRQISAQVTKGLAPHVHVKGFAVHSEYKAQDGSYGLDAAGFAAEKKQSFGPALGGLVDDVNVAGRVFGGLLQVSAPDPLSNDIRTRTNLFAGTEAQGTARINQFTGKLEVEGKTIDFKRYGDGMTTIQVRPGVGWSQKNGPLRIEAERLLESTPRDSSYVGRPAWQTAYDKVSVVVDARESDQRAYLVMKGSVYALEGITKNAATGLRAQLNAVIPSKTRGDFIVVADAAKIARNPSNDPFYDTPLSTRLSVTWRKAITRALEVGATVDISRNRMNSAFAETDDPVVPGVTDSDKTTRKIGMVWLRSTW